MQDSAARREPGGILLRRRSRRLLGLSGRWALAAALVSAQMSVPVHAAPPGPPGSQGILPSCFNIEGESGDRVLLSLRGAEFLAQGSEGALFLRLPAACLGALSAPGPAPGAPEPALTKENLEEITSRIAEKLRSMEGVDPRRVDQAKTQTDSLVGGMPSVADPGAVEQDLREASQAAQESPEDPDLLSAGLMAALTAACVAYTAGTACALLPALFGNLFGTDVTERDIRGATAIALKIGNGEALSDADYAFMMEKGGASPKQIEAFRAVKDGDPERAVWALVGENADPLLKHLVEGLSDIARSGGLTCGRIMQALPSAKIYRDESVRLRIEDVVLGDYRRYPPEERKKLSECIQAAFS